jgi:hypothetical protein
MPSGSVRPVRGPRPPDVIRHTQTSAPLRASRSDATAKTTITKMCLSRSTLDFDNLKRYAQRPIGTFHALPVARGK